MTDPSRYTYAICGVFFLCAATLGNWIPRIPDIKSRLELSEFELGYCLFALPIGTLLGLLVAARIIESAGGLKRSCRLFLISWTLLFILPVVAPSTLLFVVFLFISGLSVALIEVAMNTKADNIERQFNLRIMSRCHGFWSLGTMTGALIGGAIAQLGIDERTHFIVVMPILVLIGILITKELPEDMPVEIEKVKTSTFRLPPLSIVLLCLVPCGAMVVEGVFIDWSAVFMNSVLGAPPLLIGITFAVFSVCMAVVRLLGDGLAVRFGARQIIVASGISSFVGLMIFALAPNWIIAMFGAVLCGLGVAIVYPLTVSAAARRPGASATDNVTSVTMISFSAFLIAPPVIGLLAESFGMRAALIILSPLALSAVFLSRELSKTEE